MSASDDATKHIRRIQRKFQENIPDEKKVKYLKYLSEVPVSLELLKETAIGKSVNSLRKESGVIGELAGKLILKWKDIATSEYGTATKNKSNQQEGDVTKNRSNKQEGDVRKNKNENAVLKKNICHGVNGRSDPASTKHNKSRDIVRGDLANKNGHDSSYANKSKSNDTGDGSNRNSNKISNGLSYNENNKETVSDYRHESDESFSLDTIPITDLSGNKSKKAESKNEKLLNKEKPLGTNGNNVPDNSNKKQGLSFEDMMMMPISHVKKKKKRPAAPYRMELYTDSRNKPTLPDIKLPQMPQINAEPVYRPKRLPLPIEIQKRKETVPSPTLSLADIKSRKTKSIMYTGKKTVNCVVLSLHQLCMRVLIENVDALYETGGVPFLVLEPLLTKCNPSQLERLEYYNPHFIEDTDNLWKKHCLRDFKAQLKDTSSVAAWRDLYKDLSVEREEKLLRLSTKISESQAAKIPERSVKMAYVATVPKGSAFVQRKQKRFGTAPKDDDRDGLRELKERLEKEQSEIAEPVPFTRVPQRERCSKRPPSSLSVSGRDLDIAPRKKVREELGSQGPTDLMPQPRRRKAKKPMMLKAMQLLKKQKGRLGASIMRK